jgi:hypothetical protein
MWAALRVRNRSGGEEYASHSGEQNEGAGSLFLNRVTGNVGKHALAIAQPRLINLFADLQRLTGSVRNPAPFGAASATATNFNVSDLTGKIDRGTRVPSLRSQYR